MSSGSLNSQNAFLGPRTCLWYHIGPNGLRSAPSADVVSTVTLRVSWDPHVSSVHHLHRPGSQERERESRKERRRRCSTHHAWPGRGNAELLPFLPQTCRLLFYILLEPNYSDEREPYASPSPTFSSSIVKKMTLAVADKSSLSPNLSHSKLPTSCRANLLLTPSRFIHCSNGNATLPMRAPELAPGAAAMTSSLFRSTWSISSQAIAPKSSPHHHGQKPSRNFKNRAQTREIAVIFSNSGRRVPSPIPLSPVSHGLINRACNSLGTSLTTHAPSLSIPPLKRAVAVKPTLYFIHYCSEKPHMIKP